MSAVSYRIFDSAWLFENLPTEFALLQGRPVLLVEGAAMTYDPNVGHPWELRPLSERVQWIDRPLYAVGCFVQKKTRRGTVWLGLCHPTDEEFGMILIQAAEYGHTVLRPTGGGVE